jgi:hypothetical protein
MAVLVRACATVKLLLVSLLLVAMSTEVLSRLTSMLDSTSLQVMIHNSNKSDT